MTTPHAVGLQRLQLPALRVALQNVIQLRRIQHVATQRLTAVQASTLLLEAILLRKSCDVGVRQFKTHVACRLFRSHRQFG